MEFECWELLHGGECPRGQQVTVFVGNNRCDAAEEAAEYFDDLERHKERCGNDRFDGSVQYIEVVSKDGKSSKHEVVCEVKRVYTARWS